MPKTRRKNDAYRRPRKPKMIINTVLLRDAINHAMTAVPTAPPHPALAGLHLKTMGGNLTIRGYDYNTEAVATIPSNDKIDVLVDGRTLKDVLSKQIADQTELLEQGTILAVKTGASKASLPLMPVENYPEPVDTPKQVLTINGQDLADLINGVQHAASKDDTLPLLTSIKLVAGYGDLTVYATDRYRLATNSQTIEPGTSFEALVPQKTLLTVTRALNKTSDWTIGLDNKNICFEANGNKITQTLTAGEYPNITPLFGQQTTNSATFYRDLLLGAVTRATVLIDRMEPVTLNIHADETDVMAQDTGKGDYKETITVEDVTEEVTLRFNPHYLAEAIKATTGEIIALEWSTAPKPVRITTTNFGHQQMLMPVR